MIHERFDIQIHRLRFDKRNEYISIEFKVYLLENEIQLKLIIIDNSQMNDAIERFEQILLRKMISTLKNSDFFKDFWSKMMLTINYLINQSSIIDFNNILIEAFEFAKSNLSHLRILSFKVWFKVLKHKKLQDKIKCCVLVDYEDDWICWLLTDKDILIRSVNVHIQEKRLWTKKENRFRIEKDFAKLSIVKRARITSVSKLTETVSMTNINDKIIEILDDNNDVFETSMRETSQTVNWTLNAQSISNSAQSIWFFNVVERQISHTLKTHSKLIIFSCWNLFSIH